MSTTDVIPSLYKIVERFAQLLIKPVITVEFVESDELTPTERGDGGFGSTGTQDISAATEAQSPSKDKDESINFEPANQQAAGNNPEQV